MPVTRSQTRAVSSNTPSSRREDPSISQAEEPSTPSAAPSSIQILQHPDERTRLLYKVNRILDLFQPNDLSRAELVRAKEGIYPIRLDPVSRARTQAYMSWANALAGLALQDNYFLIEMASSVADLVLMLDEIQSDIDDVLNSYEGNHARTFRDIQDREKKLSDDLEPLMDRAVAMVSDYENPDKKEGYEVLTKTLLAILERISDRQNTVQSRIVTSTHESLMQKAISELSEFPEDVTKDFTDEMETIVSSLQRRGRLETEMTSLASELSEVLARAQRAASGN